MKQASRYLPIAFLSAVPLWPAAGLAQTPPGRDLAANCFQCHGTDGRAENGMPSIAGKDTDSLYKRTLEYSRSNKLTDIMVLQAKGYTNAQIRLIAEYFASVPEHLDVLSPDD
jgi:cytochrome c553